MRKQQMSLLRRRRTKEKFRYEMCQGKEKKNEKKNREIKNQV